MEFWPAKLSLLWNTFWWHPSNLRLIWSDWAMHIWCCGIGLLLDACQLLKTSKNSCTFTWHLYRNNALHNIWRTKLLSLFGALYNILVPLLEYFERQFSYIWRMKLWHFAGVVYDMWCSIGILKHLDNKVVTFGWCWVLYIGIVTTSYVLAVMRGHICSHLYIQAVD